MQPFGTAVQRPVRDAVVEQPDAVWLQMQKPAIDAEPGLFVGDQWHVHAVVFVPVLGVVDVREDAAAWGDATEPSQRRLDRKRTVQEMEQPRQALQVRLVDGMTIGEFAARIARALSGPEQREARFDMPLPLAFQPFGLLLANFCEHGRELDMERPPSESIRLRKGVLTALVRSLKHEPQRSKSSAAGIAFPGVVSTRESCAASVAAGIASGG